MARPRQLSAQGCPSPLAAEATERILSPTMTVAPHKTNFYNLLILHGLMGSVLYAHQAHDAEVKAVTRAVYRDRAATH